MADANVSQLEINGTTYDICDATARDSLSQYVLKSGDTMTGDLYINKASPVLKIQDSNLILDSTSNNHLEESIYPGIKFYDNTNTYVGMHDFVAYTNGNIASRVYARNIDSSGNSVENSFQVTANKDGSKTYHVADPDNFRRAISGYWPLYPDINRGVAPSATTYVEGMQWNDKRSPTKRLSFVRSIFQADGKNVLQLTVFNSPDSTGATEYGNSLHLYVAPNGTCSYAVSDPSAFRTAIGFECFGRANNLSANKTLTTTAAQIPLLNFMGKGCTASSGGIKMPYTGIYLIWGSIYLSTGAAENDIIHVQIRVNGTQIMEELFRCPGVSPYSNFTVGPWMYGAEAGQVAQLYAYNQAQANGVVTNTSSTYLMVLKIA